MNTHDPNIASHAMDDEDVGLPAPERLAQLIAAIGSGDRRAFARLYSCSGAILFGQLLHILQRRDWAEEALETCFMAIWEGPDAYDPSRGAPLVWLSAIARYHALDLLLAKRRNVVGSDQYIGLFTTMADERQPPETTGPQEQEIEALQASMPGLTGGQRRSLQLAYGKCLSRLEVSKAMNIPLGTAKHLLRLGLEQLREGVDREIGS